MGVVALTAFAPALPSPLRKTAPYGRPVHRLGDCAGRSPGSRVVAFVVQPSQFPSGCIGPKARRSQLRGQPRIPSNSKARIRRVRVPSFVPDVTRGTSTVKCSLERRRSQAGRNDVRFPPESGHAQCENRCPLSAKSGHRVADVFHNDIEVFADGQRQVVSQFDCSGEHQPCGCGPSYPSVIAISQTDLPCRSFIAEAYSGDW